MRLCKSNNDSCCLVLSLALFAPVVLGGSYLLKLDFLSTWKPISFVAVVSILHASAVFKIVRGTTVSIPWYYVTVAKEDSALLKLLYLFLLLLPSHLVLIVSYMKLI